MNNKDPDQTVQMLGLNCFVFCILQTRFFHDMSHICSQNSCWITSNELPRDKTSKVSVHPAKTQISLGIGPAWSESWLCAQWVAKDPCFLHPDSEDSDQCVCCALNG